MKMKFPDEETRLEFDEARFPNQLIAVMKMKFPDEETRLEFNEARFPNQLMAVSVNSCARR